jgi:hypothetical protein
MYGIRVETLYGQVRRRGRLGRIWSALSGRSRDLIPLAKVEARCTVRDRQAAGLQTVPIDRIRGSEGRCHDFDRDFNPIQDHSLDRWLGVARARQAAKPLPPVELIQVGDLYFCLDGHHRLSVARALGQENIEAEVTVWEVEEALPWEEPGPAAEPAPGEPRARDVQNPADRWQEQLLLTLHTTTLA